ncbi:hypothetical protein QUA27_13350 [Microcoleus sp. Pol14C6]
MTKSSGIKTSKFLQEAATILSQVTEVTMRSMEAMETTLCGEEKVRIY